MADEGADIPKPTATTTHTHARCRITREILRIFLETQDNASRHASLAVIEKGESQRERLELHVGIGVLAPRAPPIRETVGHRDPNRTAGRQFRLGVYAIDPQLPAGKTGVGDSCRGALSTLELYQQPHSRSRESDGPGSIPADTALFEIDTGEYVPKAEGHKLVNPHVGLIEDADVQLQAVGNLHPESPDDEIGTDDDTEVVLRQESV